jgi:hypothetical protein
MTESHDAIRGIIERHFGSLSWTAVSFATQRGGSVGSPDPCALSTSRGCIERLGRELRYDAKGRAPAMRHTATNCAVSGPAHHAIYALVAVVGFFALVMGNTTRAPAAAQPPVAITIATQPITSFDLRDSSRRPYPPSSPFQQHP